MDKIRSYILSGKRVFIGLEDSKKSWKLCARSGKMVVHEVSMPARYEVLHSYLSNKFPDCTIGIMYEAGFRGFELHDRLVAEGWQCVVTPPHTVTQEKCSRQKNDRIDCRRLAKNFENGDFRKCHVPDRSHREDRQISRLSVQTQKDITRQCSRIRRTIEFHGLESYFLEGDWAPRQYREAQEKLLKMNVSDSLKFTFKQLFETLNYLRSMKLETLRRLRLLAKTERYRNQVHQLQSAPGIGPLTAIRLALEWGDVKRFERKENFSSFLGLIPSDYSTGEQDHKGHITKQGNRLVRSWLIESAWIAIRHDPVLLEKYNQVVSHCGSSKKAIVAVARKLGIRLRAILLSGQPYQVGLIEKHS